MKQLGTEAAEIRQESTESRDQYAPAITSHQSGERIEARLGPTKYFSVISLRLSSASVACLNCRFSVHPRKENGARRSTAILWNCPVPSGARTGFTRCMRVAARTAPM